MVSPAMLRKLLDVLHHSGAISLSPRQLRGRGHIFCLHHVCPGLASPGGFAPNAKLEITPEFLAEVIALVRSRGFETISLGQAIERLRTGRFGDKPFSVFTLDDGYKDNYIHARDVFKHLQCPYTVFVSPGIISGESDLWWRILELLIKGAEHFHAKIAGIKFDLATASSAEKYKAWKILYTFFENLPQHEQHFEIRSLARAKGIDSVAYGRSVAMNLDELQALKLDPLCTLGGHTLNHFALAKLPDREAKLELLEAREVLGSLLGKQVLFNAYPYGDRANAGPREFKLAGEAGYKASLTTRKGVVFAAHGQNLQALPRIMVSGRFQELRYIDALISGLPTGLANGFRALNVGN